MVSLLNLAYKEQEVGGCLVVRDHMMAGVVVQSAESVERDRMALVVAVVVQKEVC